MTRLGYTQLEREAHALFGGWAESLGLAVMTDAVGNTIAELPGREPSRRSAAAPTSTVSRVVDASMERPVSSPHSKRHA